MSKYTGPMTPDEMPAYWRDVHARTRFPVVKDAAGAMILADFNIDTAQAFLREIGAEVAARHLEQYRRENLLTAE